MQKKYANVKWIAFQRIARTKETRLEKGYYEILIPVGEGYYKNEAEFNKLNPYLTDTIKEKIYGTLISTGKWKEYVESSIAAVEADPRTAAMDEYYVLVKELLDLYKNKPLGIDPKWNDQVRAIGEKLYELGGTQMMNKALREFAKEYEYHINELKKLWQGIAN